ncbi:MAG: protein kinase [Myxococcales bacterium]|nr:protein kinase [Myxococcales bacterium]
MTGARTLLIVDDEAAVTRALARLLASPALRILTTQDPAEALDLVDREPVEVVISDKDMPEMGGLALLGELRARHPRVVRILLTGQPTLDSALSAINAEGVFRYLTKPWKEPELSATIAAALERADELRHEHEARQVAERRAAAVAALAEVDPRLLEVDAGRHALAGSPLLEAIDAAVQRLRRDGATGFDARVELDDAIAASDALGLADALAAIPLFHPTIGVTLTLDNAAADTYQIALELGATVVALVGVPGATGRAVAGRLACLARVDLGSEGEHFGRVQVGVGGAEADLMLGYEPTPGGATIELRRLVSGGGELQPERRNDLLGRYRVVERVGDGATAIVYRAVHLALDRPIALKVLRPSEAREPRAVARFLREARVAARIRHPAIVELLDYGQLPDGRPFLAMEFVPWPTLDARLAGGPLRVAAAVAIAQQLAAGLGAAHAVDVIHRDLKPANIFVADDGQVRIADFGSAKLVGGPALTQDGWTVGTPLYMAPEQIAGTSSDHRLDLYAVGCILFHMLVGRPPYEAPTVRELLMRHLSAPLPELGPGVPYAVARVVHRALAKHPDDRPPTAHALADALAAAID